MPDKLCLAAVTAAVIALVGRPKYQMVDAEWPPTLTLVRSNSNTQKYI